eukprot:scaffold68103_cov18-Prasinocladus_malaysianus.AAC.2
MSFDAFVMLLSPSCVLMMISCRRSAASVRQQVRSEQGTGAMYDARTRTNIRKSTSFQTTGSVFDGTVPVRLEQPSVARTRTST